MSIENRLFPDPGDSFRRRQFRALKAALLVGLVCAAVLALLLYALYSKQAPWRNESGKESTALLPDMIPARPSPDEPDPNIMRKNRKFFLLALLVGLVSSAMFGAIQWLLNK
jgi:hypothetical protein